MAKPLPISLAAIGLVALLGGVAAPAAAGAPAGRLAAKANGTARSNGEATTDRVTALRDLQGTASVLTLDPTALAKLKAVGVSVGTAGTAKATAGGAEISLPITSGYVETHSDHAFKPNYVLGSVEHFGSGLTLSATGTSVEVTDLVFDLGQSMVYATIGGAQDVPLFSIQRGDLTVRRTGRTLRIGQAHLALTPTGAAELDALFHTSAITAYTELATASVWATGRVHRYTYGEATSEFPRLSGIGTTLSFAPQAGSVLGEVGAAPSPTGSATYDAASRVMSFPITGGTLVVHPDRSGNPASVDGVVLGQGSGLVLSRGSTSVSMTNLTLVPATSTIYASVNGGADDGAIFRLKLAKARADFAGGNLHLDQVPLVLTEGGAAMLNAVFHTADFKDGTELGQFTLVASGG